MNLKRKFNHQVLDFVDFFGTHDNFNHNEKDNDCIAHLSLMQAPNLYIISEIDALQ